MLVAMTHFNSVLNLDIKVEAFLCQRAISNVFSLLQLYWLLYVYIAELGIHKLKNQRGRIDSLLL